MLYGSEKRGNVYCKKLGYLFVLYEHVDVFTGLSMFLLAKEKQIIMIQEDGHVRLTFYLFLFCLL